MKFEIYYTLQEAKKILRWLIILELILVAFYVVTNIVLIDLPLGSIRKIFDLNQDLSIPAWFSSVQLFIVSLLLYIAYSSNQRKLELPSSFLLLGILFFVFLSIDEGAAIHEKITIAARKLDLNWLMFDGNSGAWIAVYSFLGLVGGLVTFRYFRLLWKHFRHETQIALAGAFLFVMGAVGFEVISYLFLQSGSTLHKVEVIFEELFEMSGISIILYAVLLLIKSISFSDSTPTDAKSLEGTHL